MIYENENEAEAWMTAVKQALGSAKGLTEAEAEVEAETAKAALEKTEADDEYGEAWMKAALEVLGYLGLEGRSAEIEAEAIRAALKSAA